MKYKNAIVREPGPEIVNALRTDLLEEPDYSKAVIQHMVYVETLQTCGLEVTVLESDHEYPDGCFVEDTAVLTERCAIIDNPGAPSRKGEITAIGESLSDFYTDIEHIQDPGTLEGGDVLRVNDHFYIGLSRRTNEKGARQLSRLLEKYDYSSSVVELKDMLHLKTGVAYLEKNVLLVAGEFIHNPDFDAFQKIEIEKSEEYAANCIWVNDHVLVPYGFFRTEDAIQKAGFSTIPLDVSEFQKLDGGLSCLSLRF
ncbi:dimethylarginine dimethylaminohydrolase family protein [bacterium]